MAEVERNAAAPTALAAEVATVVSQLASETVDAPRALAPALLAKLGDVAARHGGKVPLHGRLFAQWMHHAFPNECPHPHVSGTTAPKTTVAFKKSGGKVKVTAEERAKYIAAHTSRTESRENDMERLLWSEEEELLSYDDFNLQSSWAIGSSRFLAILVSFVLLAAFMSVTVGSARSGSATLGGAKGTFWAQEKYMV